MANDIEYMTIALSLARHAESIHEVPIGAVVVCEGRILGEGWNSPVSDHDATAHAEIKALRQAMANVANYRLPPGTSVYVTIEPCAMCAGSLVHARVDRLVFAAREPRAGAIVSRLQYLDLPHLNHRVNWCEGILEKDATALMRSFFQARR